MVEVLRRGWQIRYHLDVVDIILNKDTSRLRLRGNNPPVLITVPFNFLGWLSSPSSSPPSPLLQLPHRPFQLEDKVNHKSYNGGPLSFTFKGIELICLSI